jgi:LCP family protein required for cell wall assembly
MHRNPSSTVNNQDVTSCRACGSSVSDQDSFCSACGTKLDAGHDKIATDSTTSSKSARQVERRRIGGSVYLAEPPSAESDIAHVFPGLDLVPGSPISAGGGYGTSSSSRSRRRRRNRRRWYRKPLIVVPLVALLLVVALGGGIAWRASSTVATLQEVSTPPPAVNLAMDEDDAGSGQDKANEPVAIDTGPARQALTDSGYDPGQTGGIRGRFGTFGDMAEGAAVAAGMTDASAPPMTILVMGVDAQAGEAIDIGVRADILMVVRLDPANGGCRLLSVPRDTRTELPGYGLSKVNHALAVGGIPYQLLVTEKLLGIKIDHYALINFEGFQDLVDAVGGIPVDVPATVTKGDVTVEKGEHVLDGKHALAYARYRDPATEGDAGRIKRQWALLGGLGQVAEQRDLIRDVNGILPAIEAHIRSDMTPKDMASIAKTYGSGCQAESVDPVMLAGTRVRLEDPILHQAVYYNIVDSAIIRDGVEELLGTGS